MCQWPFIDVIGAEKHDVLYNVAKSYIFSGIFVHSFDDWYISWAEPSLGDVMMHVE